MTYASSPPAIIDYEGSHYRTDFWEGRGRDYEDLAERYALRRLLPHSGDILVEVGAGFGRLADMYDGYRQIVLIDYSLSLLTEAYERWGHDPRFIFLAANVYHLPLATGTIQALTMVRVMHHLQDPSLALAELSRVLVEGGVMVLEYANKRNLKAILRYWSGRQAWNPFSLSPYEFVPLNYDFHPTWMEDKVREAGFAVEEELSISLFRWAPMKSMVAPQRLAWADHLVAGPVARIKPSPSVMMRNRNLRKHPPAEMPLLACPACRGGDLRDRGSDRLCPSCQRSWPIVGGVIDLRWPRPADP